MATPITGITARQLVEQEGRIVTLTGYLITTKPVSTKNGKRMAFGYFLDAEGQYFDTTHFPAHLERYPLRGLGMYRIEGKVVLEYGCPGIEVQKLERLPFWSDPRGNSDIYIYELYNRLKEPFRVDVNKNSRLCQSGHCELYDLSPLQTKNPAQVRVLVYVG